MNLLFILPVLAAIYFFSIRSASCILRNKAIPADAAKTVRRILSAAFCIIYFFAAAALYAAAVAPQSAELVRSFLFPPKPASTSSSAPPTEAPQGKIAAEQNRTERQLLIAKNTEQQDITAAERRKFFGQEQPYVVPEGISGTEDRYVPPKNETIPVDSEGETASAATKISVQQMVSSSGDISSILTASRPQPVAESPAPQPTATPSPVEQPPTSVQSAAQTTAPQQKIPILAPKETMQQVHPVQMQPSAQDVSCREIKMYMDATDEQLFHRAMKREAGVATEWKGPAGSYVVVPASIKGYCREYGIQAAIQGRSLRCYAACASAANVSNVAQQQRNDKAVILNSMNSNDQDALIKALSYHGPVSWRSLSGIFYTISPVRLGNPCREYTVQANIQGRILQYLESNCQ
jgi:hypothetical protein